MFLNHLVTELNEEFVKVITFGYKVPKIMYSINHKFLCIIDSETSSVRLRDTNRSHVQPVTLSHVWRNRETGF